MALADETVVTLENGVTDTLNMPDGATGAAVLMLHGFGSARDEGMPTPLRALQRHKQ